MSLDFLSGLLLAVVVVGGVAYMLKEWFASSGAASADRERTGRPPAGANAHLIGAIGRVVEVEPGTGEIRVRIGAERWKARLASSGAAPPPVGAEVEVKAVDGLVLEVIEKAPAAAPPTTPPESEQST